MLKKLTMKKPGVILMLLLVNFGIINLDFYFKLEAVSACFTQCVSIFNLDFRGSFFSRRTLTFKAEHSWDLIIVITAY